MRLDISAAYPRGGRPRALQLGVCHQSWVQVHTSPYESGRYSRTTIQCRLRAPPHLSCILLPINYPRFAGQPDSDLVTRDEIPGSEDDELGTLGRILESYWSVL